MARALMKSIILNYEGCNGLERSQLTNNSNTVDMEYIGVNSTITIAPCMVLPGEVTIHKHRDLLLPSIMCTLVTMLLGPHINTPAYLRLARDIH
jgi:hypothetical protein